MSGPRHRQHIPFQTSVMKIEDLADYLKVHRSTIYRLLKRKKLPGFRMGTEWRFNREQIDAWRFNLEAGHAR